MPKVRKTSKKRSTLRERFAGNKEPLAPRLARLKSQYIFLTYKHFYGGEGGIRTREAVLPAYTLSKRAPSATRTPHHMSIYVSVVNLSRLRIASDFIQPCREAFIVNGAVLYAKA